MSALLNNAPQGANGVLSVNGTLAPTYWNAGLPFDATGLAVDNVTAISYRHQGLPFTANGRIAITTNSPGSFGSGAALFAISGKLCMANAVVTNWANGVPYISTGQIQSLTA